MAPLFLALVLAHNESAAPKVVRLSGHFQVMCYTKEANAKLRFPLPMLTEYQTPLSFQFSPATNRRIKSKKVVKGDLENRMLEIEFNPLATREKIAIKWDSDVVIDISSETKDFKAMAASPIPAQYPSEVASWTRPSVWVQSDDPQILAIAKKITRSTVVDTMNEALKECAVIQNRARTRVGDEWTDREKNNCGAAQAVILKGQCTSKANLFAAVLRASGIPARTVAGYLETSQPLETHYMVDYYVEGFGWQRIDPSGYSPLPGLYFPVAVNSIRSENYRRGSKIGPADGVPLNSLNETEGSILTFAADSGTHSVRTQTNIVVDTEALPRLRRAWIYWLAESQLAYRDFGRVTK